MWRTERGQRYSKLVNRRLDACHILQRRLNESPTFIFHSFVVGANQLNQITLHLVRDHFQDVGQQFRQEVTSYGAVALPGYSAGTGARDPVRLTPEGLLRDSWSSASAIYEHARRASRKVRDCAVKAKERALAALRRMDASDGDIDSRTSGVSEQEYDSRL
jgi:hypothetical protein